MLNLILDFFKIIPVSIVLAIWYSWIAALEQLMRKRPWENNMPPLPRKLAKIAIIASYLITGLIGTVVAYLIIIIIL